MIGDQPYTGDPALLRRINAVAVLRVMYAGDPLRLAQVVERTGLSRRTVEAVLDELACDGLVRETPAGRGTGTVGRPARSYQFRTDVGHVLAVEVRRRRTVCVLADLAGEVVAESSRPVAATAERRERVGTVVAAARDALHRARVPKKRLRAVAVATPGVVRDGSDVTHCSILPDWTGFSLRGELASFFSCPVHVENDVNLAAIGERWRGACADVDTVVWVLVGRRARVATIIDGTLYRGAGGAAGEIGWVPALGWSDVRDHALSFAGFEHTPESERAERTLAAAAHGDGAALASVDALAGTLAQGLAAVVLALDPACLVIGGGPARAGDVLSTAVRRHLEPYCLRLPDVRTSVLGDEAVLTGGVRAALNEVESQLFAV
ncbi:MAG: ROK family protein [Streptosporangiales bacterium]